MNEYRNKMNKSKKRVTGKPLPGSSTSFNAKQVGVTESDKISMSKQLSQRKIEKAKVKKNPPKIKTNKRHLNRGKRLMPSFSDLEKMFDDSEVAETNDKLESNDINSNLIQTESKINETVTLTQNLVDSESNHCNVNNIISVGDRQIKTLSSPNSLNCNRTVESLSPDLIILPKPIDSEIIVIDDEEPQNVILTEERKRKKIIIENGDIILDCDHPQKIRRLSESSHAINNDPDGSDSDATIIYDLEGPPKNLTLKVSNSFSPLPSTSTDSVIISENDKSFMNSLSKSKNSTFTEISKKYQDVVLIDDIYPKYSTQEAHNLGKDMEERVEEPLQQESYSDNIDGLMEANHNSNELVDVDAIIAENECILTKYKTVDNLPNIIEVEPRQNITQINTLVHVDLNCSTSNNQGPRSVSTPIVTNENISTQFQNSNINYINHRKTGRSTALPINTVTQNNRNCTVISSQNTRPEDKINNCETLDVTSSLNCPICFENLRSRVCASTICGHIFCMGCLKKALKNTKRCPTCRKIVKGQGYHRLFL